MRLAKLLKFMSVIIVLSLVYIHMQMQIIDLAYQGKNKDRHLKKLIEENGNISYSISMLKSANYLGLKMLSEDSDMQFVNHEDIVQISTPPDFSGEALAVKQVSLKNKASLLSLLSFSAQAEARQQ